MLKRKTRTSAGMSLEFFQHKDNTHQFTAFWDPRGCRVRKHTLEATDFSAALGACRLENFLSHLSVPNSVVKYCCHHEGLAIADDLSETFQHFYLGGVAHIITAK